MLRIPDKIHKLLMRWRPSSQAPEVGQIWQSAWNGEKVKVERIEISAKGDRFVTLVTWYDKPWFGAPARWGMGESYLLSDRAWRRMMRAERRTLINP